MAGLSAVLNTLRLLAGRDLGKLRGIKFNNLFLLVALMVYGAAVSGVEPGAAEPLLFVLGLLLLFPLSGDPLARIPSPRATLWPLTRWHWLALRAGSLALSPIFWIVLAILFGLRRPWFALTFVLLALSTQVFRSAGWEPLRYIPRFPGGIGQLMRNDLRQMLSVLDTYAAILIGAGAISYRFLYSKPDPAAFPVCAMLVGLAVSTYAQCLFGLDSTTSAFTRYRLLPVAGWQILAAKDAAFLLLLFLLTLPLDVLAGMTFGLSALAIGHYPSVLIRVEQHPWRFTGAKLFPAVLQAFISLALGFRGYWYAALLLYAISLYICGKALDRVLSAESSNSGDLAKMPGRC